jgi:hypothetical protein
MGREVTAVVSLISLVIHVTVEIDVIVRTPQVPQVATSQVV